MARAAQGEVAGVECAHHAGSMLASRIHHVKAVSVAIDDHWIIATGWKIVRADRINTQAHGAQFLIERGIIIDVDAEGGVLGGGCECGGVDIGPRFSENGRKGCSQKKPFDETAARDGVHSIPKKRNTSWSESQAPMLCCVPVSAALCAWKLAGLF